MSPASMKAGVQDDMLSEVHSHAKIDASLRKVFHMALSCLTSGGQCKPASEQQQQQQHCELPEFGKAECHHIDPNIEI